MKIRLVYIKLTLKGAEGSSAPPFPRKPYFQLPIHDETPVEVRVLSYSVDFAL